MDKAKKEEEKERRQRVIEYGIEAGSDFYHLNNPSVFSILFCDFSECLDFASTNFGE